MHPYLISLTAFSFQSHRLAHLLLAALVSGMVVSPISVRGQEQDVQRLSPAQREACRTQANQGGNREEQARLFRECRRKTLGISDTRSSAMPEPAPNNAGFAPSTAPKTPSTSPASTPNANGVTATPLLKQMISIAADNGGIGHTTELSALKQQIEALPKPVRGDKKVARAANDMGLAVFNAGKYDEAKGYFIDALKADPADVEAAGNLGLAAIKTGDFKQAIKALSTALALAPGRAATWANLADYYALQGQQKEAVACYALTFHFSQNQNKTRDYLQKKSASTDDPRIQQAAQQALQLSLIKGSSEAVAAVPTEDSLDAPLPPATPTPRALPTTAPPVVAPPAAPPIATPPVTASAAPSAPPPVAPVASSPIPSSLLPPAANNAAAPAPSGDAAASTGNDDIVEVVAQGMGTDQPSALSNAYSNAVQQALGLYVDAETMVQNDQIVRDQILTYSKGFIQKVDIVSQNQANGLFQVNIHAQVKRQKLMEQAKANNITLKQVDGQSLHGQVETQVKQEQDAKVLLEKALLPFTGVTLYHVELAGEPKIIKNGNQGSTTLAYPVSFYVDDVVYKKAAGELIAVLDNVASGKKEAIETYETVLNNKNKEIKMVRNQVRSSKSQGKCEIAIMAWRDKSFTKSKWLIYSLSDNLLSKELIGKFKTTARNAILELNLLNSENKLIALGDIEITIGGYGSPVYFETSQNSCASTLKTYTDSANEIFHKLQYNVNITVASDDLPTIKTAKLLIKMKGE